MCLLKYKPTVSSDEGLSSSKAILEKWEKINHLSLLVIKRSISETIWDGILSCDTTTEFFGTIGPKFKESYEAEITYLLKTFPVPDMTIWRSQIPYFENFSYYYQIKESEYSYDGWFVIHQVLNFLPIKFEQLNTSYIVLVDKWSIDELIFVCIAEEDIMNYKRAERAHFVIAPLSKKVTTTIKGSSFKRETIKVIVKIKD